LETYTELKAFLENPNYQVQRRKSLCNLTDDMIDPPIIGVINRFNKLPYCFTLQSCYGHFIFNSQKDPYNLDPLPVIDTVSNVVYRVAYITVCIENSAAGRWLFEELKAITFLNPANIQFCCADWFWNRHVNSYALQVEPDRFKHKDTAVVDFKEALIIEKVRNEVFIKLNELLESINNNKIGIQG